MNSRDLAKTAIKKKAIQKVKELSSLISLLKKRKLKTIVEIGTYKGGTLYAWCKIAEPDATIISIDMPGGPFGGGYKLKDIKKLRGYAGKKQRLYLLRKNSQLISTKQEVMKLLKGKQIDFLMIDGDHSYSGVKKDFRLYSSLVKNGGLIVFHDILFHPKVPKCRVEKFWKEIKPKYKTKELTFKKNDRGWGQWGGIGVIYYKTNLK